MDISPKYRWTQVSALVVTLLALGACVREPGPAEKAGKAVDNAVEKAGQNIEKAGQRLEDAAKGGKK
jgi:Tfp pilus assembly protein PilF